MSSPRLPEPLPDSPASKGTTVMILSIMIALGAVVSYNWLLSLKRQQNTPDIRLPMQGRVETDPLPVWLDQNGRERHLEELKGKVFVVSSVYTACPHGCTGVAEELEALRKEFGSDPNFAILTVSADAERDRPAVLKAWMDGKGFGGENWLVLTSPDGQGQGIRDWLAKTFRIFAKRRSDAEILANPADPYDHQEVLALVDGNGNIRTPTDNVLLYWPRHAAFDHQMFPRSIREDIIKLLAESRQPKP